MQKVLEYLGISNRPIIGLELSSSAVKVMLITKKDNKLKILDFYLELLPPNKIKEKKIIDQEYVTEVLQRAFDKLKDKTTKVCICLPSYIAINKVVSMPNTLLDADIGDEIALDAEKYISFPIEDVNIDYQILGPTAGKDGFNDVVIYACKTEDLSNLVEIVESVGFKVEVVETDSIALQRCFELILKQLPVDATGRIVTLFDLGSDIISLTVFLDNTAVYYREQNFGGSQLFNEIQTRYGLTFEETVASTKFNDLPEDYIQDILEPFKKAVVNQIERSIRFYLSSASNLSIDYIFLTGGVSVMSGIEELVQSKLGIKTFCCNPFIGMIYSSIELEEIVTKNRAVLMTCTGLAMRDLV